MATKELRSFEVLGTFTVPPEIERRGRRYAPKPDIALQDRSETGQELAFRG
ncbi:hypothetical protein GCM10009591_14450 [Brachybacterium tyrofermentans]